LILSLLASPAWAEVCDKLRPEWDGTRATALGEAIALFSSPLGLLLLLGTALAVRFRSAWGGLGITVGWTILITFVVSNDPTGLQKFAIEEGCIGPMTLFIPLVIAICIATILYTAPRQAGDN